MAEAMRKFLQQSRLKGSVLALQITEVWEEIMGKTIARYTDKIEIHGTTLYIQTAVAPLKQELLYKNWRLFIEVSLHFQLLVLRVVTGKRS